MRNELEFYLKSRRVMMEDNNTQFITICKTDNTVKSDMLYFRIHHDLLFIHDAFRASVRRMIFLPCLIWKYFRRTITFDTMPSTIRKQNGIIAISRLSVSYMDERNRVGCISWELEN